jgi:nucleotide-binding universal stress UspA family protein
MPQQIHIDRILCPVDFSIFSRHAVSRAVRLAQWFRSSVTVVHVIYPTPWLQPGEPGRPSAAEAQEWLAARRAEHAQDLERMIAPHRHCGVAIDARLVDGEEAAQIRQLALALPADLIVMGTHGYGGFKHLLLGSVAEKLLRVAPCPVLTVGGEEAKAAQDHMFHRIVCALDLTDSSRHTLDVALSLADETLARMTLIHLVESLPGEAAAQLCLANPELGPLRRDLQQLAREHLHTMAAEHPMACELDEVVGFGTAWRGIVEEARRIHADLIVVGAHAHGPVARVLLGTTASHVVREAPCPVLVVRDRVGIVEAQRAQVPA